MVVQEFERSRESKICSFFYLASTYFLILNFQIHLNACDTHFLPVSLLATDVFARFLPILLKNIAELPMCNPCAIMC